MNPEEFPVVAMDRDHAEGRSQIYFGHQGTRTVLENQTDGVVHRRVA